MILKYEMKDQHLFISIYSEKCHQIMQISIILVSDNFFGMLSKRHNFCDALIRTQKYQRSTIF